MLRARELDPAARAALAELCEAYWNPVYRFLRREGRAEDHARELAQAFFARLLASSGVSGADPGRGRFRSYLLGALRHFLADQRDHDQRKKRGAGVAPESLEATIARGTDTDAGTPLGQTIPDATALTPDAVFDRAWALSVMDRALKGVASEFSGGRKAEQFRILKPWLTGDVPGASQAEAARQLGLTEGAVKVVVHRLRKRFREAVRAEIAQTLPADGNVDGELRYLIDVLTLAAATDPGEG